MDQKHIQASRSDNSLVHTVMASWCSFSPVVHTVVPHNVQLKGKQVEPET